MRGIWKAGFGKQAENKDTFRKSSGHVATANTDSAPLGPLLEATTDKF